MVMLCKQWMCSDQLSQPPTVILPKALAQDVCFAQGLVPLPRNALPPRSVNEYRKMANTVEKQPWQLKAAAE